MAESGGPGPKKYILLNLIIPVCLWQGKNFSAKSAINCGGYFSINNWLHVTFSSLFYRVCQIVRLFVEKKLSVHCTVKCKNKHRTLTLLGGNLCARNRCGDRKGCWNRWTERRRQEIEQSRRATRKEGNDRGKEIMGGKGSQENLKDGGKVEMGREK